MTYDFSFDGKSVAALVAGSVVLCVLLFVTGVLVGAGWGTKTEASAQQAAKTADASADAAAQPVTGAQPATLAAPPRASAALPPEPVLYDDPARHEYASQGYGARGYEQPAYGGQSYGQAQGYAARDYAAQGQERPRYAAPEPAAQQASAPPATFSARGEAERLNARSIDPDPRVVSEYDETASPSSYSVQVGAYLEEKEARRLAADLENKGYTPTVFAGTDSEARRWYAVRIGSYASPKDAGAAATNFVKQEKLKASVRPSGSL